MYQGLTLAYENYRRRAPGSPQHNLTQWVSHYLISANVRLNGRTDNKLDEEEEDVNHEKKDYSRRAIHDGRRGWREPWRRLLVYMNEQEWSGRRKMVGGNVCLQSQGPSSSGILPT